MCGALGDGVGERGLGLGLLLFGELLRGAGKRLEPASKGLEVAHRVRARDRIAQRRDGLGHVRGWSPATHALLEQGDLPGEVGVLALEVREGLFGRRVGVLTDLPLAVARSHEDGARLVDAAPRLLI